MPKAPKATSTAEAGPSARALPPLMGMDDAAGSSSWGRKASKRKAAAAVDYAPVADADADDDDEDQDEAAEGDDNDEEPEEGDGSGESGDMRAAPKKKKRKTKTAGVVYISRLPPGMTPHKVRHLMARWGDVGRVYAQRRDAPTGYNPNAHKDKARKKHQSANFDEAWVEFMDKSIAKTVAGMMNAQPIGGKKGDRWRDDVWTMKYLSGFKWEMLGDQVAYERNVYQSRLRAEITRAKAEQNSYLQNVELARVLGKREERKRAAAAAEGDAPAASTDGGAKGAATDKSKRSYRQREVVDRAHGLAAKGMDSVLGNIFG